MRNRIFIFFLLFSSQSFAQLKPKPTAFDSFIIRPSIEWAAYANDKINFEKINFNKLLLDRYTKNEIVAALPVYKDLLPENYIYYLKKDSLEEYVLYPCCVDPILDSNGNPPASFKRKPLTIDSSQNTFSLVTQVIYIENGRLKSYIPWVNPEMLNMEYFDWMTSYCSTCFNFNRNEEIIDKNKPLFLSQTKRKLNPDSFKIEDKLKELYGRNLLETLWPYILKGNLPIFSIKTGKKIDPDSINNFIISRKAVHKFLYDSAGIEIGEAYVNEAPLPFNIKQIELIQNWYYDYTENKVFCKIPELIIYSDKWADGHEVKEDVPILKIVFN